MSGHYRIYSSGPIARPGWRRRLYPVAELLTLVGMIALIGFVFFFATWQPS